MRIEFQRGLVFQGDLDGIARDLRQVANQEYQQKLKRIDSELAAAKLIRLGLSEPQSSEANRVAQGFMTLYRTVHAGELKQNAELLNALRTDTKCKKRKPTKPKPADGPDDAELMQEPPTIDDL